MKQKLLNSIRLRVWMLVAVLFTAFAGQAWGQAVTLYSETFGTTGDKTNVSDYTGFSSNLITPTSDAWKISGPSTSTCGITGSSGSCNAYCGSTSDLIFDFDDNFSGYTSVTLSFNYNKGSGNGKANTLKLYISADGGTNYGDDLLPSNTGAGGWYSVTNIAIPAAALSNLCIKFSSSTNTNRLDDIKITGISAAPSYSITAVSNNESYGTVSLTGSTITGSPKSGYRYASPAYTVTSGTATVAQDGNYFTVTPSEDCTVQINFEPIPTHTATFSVNGNTTSEDFQEGASIEFPDDPDDIEGKTFVGWYNSEYSNASVAPDYVNTATATMGNANVTYYAVYADVAEEVSEDMEDAVKSQTLQYDTWTYSGSTSNKSSYRLFGNGSYIESEAFDLSKLIKVVVYGGTFGGADTYNSGTIGDGTNKWNDITLTGNGNTKAHTFTGGSALSGTKALRITSTAGNGTDNGLRISKVEIYIKGTVRTESNYTTDIRSEAGISFAEAEVSVQRTSGYTGQALTNPNDVTVAYSSSDETVATVTGSTGAIELLKAGTTTITASFAGDATYKPAEVSYELTVTEKLPNGLVYVVAEVEKLTTDAAFTNELTNGYSLTVAYSSSDTDVATVNASTGEVTIKGAGSTTITAAFEGDATYEEGEASYLLTVSMATPTLSFAKSSVNVELDEETYKQVVTTEPADLPVTYSSSNESVATVAADGTVTLLTTGSTTITANFAGNDFYNSASASYTLKVDVFATLPFSFDGGKTDVENKTGLTQNGLGTDYGSSPKMQFNGTGDYLILKYAGSANVLTFDIKGNSFSGCTFKVQYSEDGSSYIDLKTYDALNAVQNESFDNIPASARYIKWIYTNKSSGNVALGNISVTGGDPITIGEAGYTTYVSKHKVSFPEGVTAYIATDKTSESLILNSKASVPAGTPVIVKAAPGTYQLPVITIAPEPVSGNLLLASNGSITGDGSTIFALGVGKVAPYEGVVGFYLVKDGKTVPAGKAYMEIPAGGSTKGFTFDFDDVETGVNAIAKGQEATANGQIFNLAGQRVNKAQKGLYIMNGKKVLVK